MDLDWNSIAIVVGLVSAASAITRYITKLEMKVEKIDKNQGISSSANIHESKEDPLGILERRLASGEINAEEFDKLKKKLKGR